MAHRKFEAGNEIIHQGDHSDMFAIVVSGLVKLTRLLPDGRQQIVAVLTSGDCLGQLSQDVAHDGATCLCDVELCCFDRSKFARALEAIPKLKENLVGKLEDDLNEARLWLTVLGRMGAFERVAVFLFELWNRQQSQCGKLAAPVRADIVTLPLKRADIADFLGLTIETVSRNITKLRAAGIIDLHDSHSVAILDPVALERLGQIN